MLDRMPKRLFFTEKTEFHILRESSDMVGMIELDAVTTVLKKVAEE